MTADAPDSVSNHDPLEAALEASCDALITLEALHCTASRISGADDLDAHVVHAVNSLREAIDELRLARINRPAGVPIGFVLERRRH